MVLDARGQPACLHTTSPHLSADIQLSPVITAGNVHAARERPCDITREYDCIRYYKTLLSLSLPLSGDYLVVSSIVTADEGVRIMQVCIMTCATFKRMIA